MVERHEFIQMNMKPHISCDENKDILNGIMGCISFPIMGIMNLKWNPSGSKS
jgi:hypothetical protein